MSRQISESHKEAIRRSKLGKSRSPETIAKIKASKQNISVETKEKLRQAKLGTKHSEETKKKMSESKKGTHTGQNNSMYGRKLSEEHKQRLHKSGQENGMWGRQHSEATKNRIRLLALERASLKSQKPVIHRRSIQLLATPAWLTKEDHIAMRSLYAASRQIERETGTKHHVDHIIPLRGKNVCGLHVPWNLRVLDAKSNFSKSNKCE